MIQAEQLMIGDLVHCVTDNVTHEIESFGEDRRLEVNGKPWYMVNGYFNVLSDVEPIAITKDIMDANFEFDEDYFDEFFKDQGTLPYKVLFTAIYSDGKTMKNYWRLMYNTTSGLVTIEDNPCIRVKYVHELQHMLRLMGLRGDIKLPSQSA